MERKIMKTDKQHGSVVYNILFCALLALLLANLCYWGKRKEGFFGDELYSYHYVNQIAYPYITEDREEITWMNSWHSSEYFKDYLTINEGEAFDIWGTYQSISKDVHPPLFYILLEVVCSAFSLIFPGAFSKWCGILINIVFMMLTVLVLYRMTGRICEKRSAALTVCLLYGFSVGAVSTAVFLRMYSMFTFACVVFTYINTVFWKEIWVNGKEQKAAPYIGLCISAIFGILCHYYFLVYAFGICIFIWVCALVMKRYHFAVKYALTMAAGILGAYLIWPDMKNDIFSGYRGEEAFGNFAGNMNWDHFREFLSLADAELFGSCGGVFLLVLLCAILYILISGRWRIGKRFAETGEFSVTFEKKERPKKTEFRVRYYDPVFLQISFAVLFYIFVISKIAPYREDRYIFNVFPMVFLLAIYAVNRLGNVPGGRQLEKIVSWMLIVFMGVGYFTSGVNYLYKGTGKKLETADLYSDLPVFYVNNGSTFRACGDSVYFSKAYAVYPMSPASEVDFSDKLELLAYSEDTEMSRCLVYIDLNISGGDAILDQVRDSLGAGEVRQLYQTEYSAVYIVE